jgi:Tfp pilus assembly protein PilF
MLPQARINELLQQAVDVLNRAQPTALELEGAKTGLDEILTADSRNADALQLLGLIYAAMRRNTEAEAMYRQSLAARPEQPHVHHNLGNLLLSEGRVDEAIAAQREALRLKRNYLAAHLNLALALYKKGDLKAAEKTYRNALHCGEGFCTGDFLPVWIAERK